MWIRNRVQNADSKDPTLMTEAHAVQIVLSSKLLSASLSETWLHHVAPSVVLVERRLHLTERIQWTMRNWKPFSEHILKPIWKYVPRVTSRTIMMSCPLGFCFFGMLYKRKYVRKILTIQHNQQKIIVLALCINNVWNHVLIFINRLFVFILCFFVSLGKRKTANLICNILKQMKSA